MTTEPATIHKGEKMARQTEQAKLLREARDQLAARAQAMADKKDRRGLERMGLPANRAKELIAGKDFNTEDLAGLLGVSLKGLRSWLEPTTSATNRGMPKTAKLLLARILAER